MKKDKKSPLTPDFGREIKLKLNRQKSTPWRKLMIASGIKAPIIGSIIKNWNWLIVAQRDWGEDPDIREVETVVADITETDVEAIAEVVELLISEV